MSKHNFRETLDNESDLRKTLGYNELYNNLKNNFLVLKIHQMHLRVCRFSKFSGGGSPYPPGGGGPPHTPSPWEALLPGTASTAHWCSGYFPISAWYIFHFENPGITKESTNLRKQLQVFNSSVDILRQYNYDSFSPLTWEDASDVSSAIYKSIFQMKTMFPFS